MFKWTSSSGEEDGYVTSLQTDKGQTIADEQKDFSPGLFIMF